MTRAKGPNRSNNGEPDNNGSADEIASIIGDHWVETLNRLGKTSMELIEDDADFVDKSKEFHNFLLKHPASFPSCFASKTFNGQILQPSTFSFFSPGTYPFYCASLLRSPLVSSFFLRAAMTNA